MALNNPITEEVIQVGDLQFEKWLSKKSIHEKIEQLAEEIRAVYEGKEVIVIGVLNGGVFITIDLVRALNIPCRLDFVQAASYVGTTSTGEVKMTAIKERIENCHVLLVEDIVDTGRTIQVIKKNLMKQQPASLRIASLFYKPEADLFNCPPDFVGFPIPNAFILGYGLDYNGLGRELEDVYRAKE